MSGQHRKALPLLLLLSLLILMVGLIACGDETNRPEEQGEPASTVTSTETGNEAESTGKLTVYSGRSEELVGDLVTRFQEATGIETEVRYGDTAELAGTILEEGDNSPADVFFAQDAGALGALAKAGRLQRLSDELLTNVAPRFRSQDGLWVGVSGRARVLVYNTQDLTEAELPQSIMDLTDPKWQGQIGWAPTNGSFQAFVTALRVSSGEDAARDWLKGIQDNNPKVYEKNTAIVDAVGSGEVQVGLVNHYYLYNLLKERGDGFPAANYFFPKEDTGNMVNVAGAGILDSAGNAAAAQEFISFLLSDEAQTYFSEQTTEYPLVDGIQPDARLKPLSEIAMPNLDLSDLDSLEQTLTLLQEMNII